jgi:acetyl-CoA carboxylase biotin carboxyl carrier protein|tara:strand:+ start:9238 stop:9669 length:432 start_codon:yes stop_codon:yes gene_type:complete
MDIRKIKKLIEMLQESDLNEIEVSQGEESVRISRGNNNTVSTQMPLNNNPIQVPEIGKEEIQPELSGNQIKTPIVGTFYRRPNPEKAAFINVGDIIEVGDVVCIVEAMKMMNEIKSEYSGKVVSIIAEDGQPVEFDQTLIIIE